MKRYILLFAGFILFSHAWGDVTCYKSGRTLFAGFTCKNGDSITIEQFRNPHFSRQTSEHQFDNMQRQFTAIFKSLMDKGILDNDDPEMMAMEYYAPVSLLIQLCDREPDRKEEVMGKVEKYIDFFLNRYFKKAQTA